MKTVFSSVFEEDFSGVIAYYATEVSPELSVRFENQVVECFRLISKNPELGRRRKDLAQPEMRSLGVADFENHLIFYQVRKDDLFFVRLLHGARNLTALL